MSTVTLFSTLGIKSQLKNVRFLHKLGLIAFQNVIVVNSPIFTITKRQFTLDSDLLRRRRNPRLNDLGAGLPVEGALVSSSPGLVRTSWVLQFVETCDPEQLTLASLKFIFKTLLDCLKIYKSSSAEKKSVLASVGMQKLCRAVEKNCLNIFPKDLLNIFKLFMYLNTPGNHPTFQMVLRRLSKHANSDSLSPFDILFLHFLMNQMRKEHKSPTSDAITQALPKIFESQLSKKLIDTNLWELIDCLQYAVTNQYSESVLNKILKSIAKKQSQLNYEQAHSLVWYLADCPHGPVSAELFETSFKILGVNIPLLTMKHLKISSFCATKSMAVMGHFDTEVFTETPVNRPVVEEAHRDEDHIMEDVMAWDTFITMTWSKILGRRKTPPCLHCAGKTETLYHVLSECGKGNQLRSARHHEILSIIANALREAPSFGQGFWIVEEEVECRDENGSPRRVDIFCYDKEQKVGYIIDPTVRFEQYTERQAIKVDREKRTRYEPCAKYFKNLYGLDQVEVIGLLVGSRGIMTYCFEEFRKHFGLSPTFTQDISVAAIRGSALIVYYHLYTRRGHFFKVNGTLTP